MNIYYLYGHEYTNKYIFRKYFLKFVLTCYIVIILFVSITLYSVYNVQNYIFLDSQNSVKI